MRHTKSHSANRRSHHALKERGLVSCQSCGTSKENHKVCENCGKYKGRQVLDVFAKAEKKEKKRKEKEKAG
jgi:large subunit ribosomal protein L32